MCIMQAFGMSWRSPIATRLLNYGYDLSTEEQKGMLHAMLDRDKMLNFRYAYSLGSSLS